MEKTTLVAPDISCEHCQHTIEGAVGKLVGVNVSSGYSSEIGANRLRSAASYAGEDRRGHGRSWL